MQYNVVGFSERWNDFCLVYACGKYRETAEEILKRIRENPNENDKHMMKGLRDFKIEEIPDSDAWWLQGSLD